MAGGSVGEEQRPPAKDVALGISPFHALKLSVCVKNEVKLPQNDRPVREVLGRPLGERSEVASGDGSSWISI
jgi:hypothetical protein